MSNKHAERFQGSVGLIFQDLRVPVEEIRALESQVPEARIERSGSAIRFVVRLGP
jgi:hypothetical protein